MSDAIGGVVLAAGASVRLGRPKQLVDFGGEPLVRAPARALASSRCGARAIVVGARGEDVAAAVADLGLAVLVNDDWPEGIASSLRRATRWAEGAGLAGLLVATSDQPFLTAAHVDALLAALVREARRIGSAYAGVVGVPAVFPRADFPALLALRGDRGAGALLRAGAGSVAWPEGAIDVDDEAALAAAREARGG